MNRRTFLRITGAAVTGIPHHRNLWAQQGNQNRTRGEIPIRRSIPETQGISSSAIHTFVEEAEKNLDSLHSLMIARNGYVVAEGWWAPYSSDLNHWLFSLSKGFTATGVGVAIDEGHLSLDDSVVSFFPEKMPKLPSENLKAMKVRHLLQMTHGHQGSSDREVMRSEDTEWVRAWLEMEVPHVPGVRWAYSNSVTYMLSAIVQRATGQSLMNFMQPRLFEPLGITNPIWDTSPEGITIGGSGLRVRTEAILRLGQLYLQRGRWQGEQLLSQAWIAEATKLQATPGGGDTIQGFGLHFVLHPDRGAFESGGLFGQSCIVMPDKNAVVAITAGVRQSAMKIVSTLVWEHIHTAMGGLGLPEDKSAHDELLRKLDSLVLPLQRGTPNSKMANIISNRKFIFEENERGIISLELESSSTNTVLTLTNDKGKHRLVCKAGVWANGHTAFEPPALVTLGLVHDGSEVPCATSGAWLEEDTFVIKLCYTESPFMEILTFKFEMNRVTFDQVANLSMKRWTPRKRPQSFSSCLRGSSLQYWSLGWS